MTICGWRTRTSQTACVIGKRQQASAIRHRLAPRSITGLGQLFPPKPARFGRRAPNAEVILAQMAPINGRYGAKLKLEVALVWASAAMKDAVTAVSSPTAIPPCAIGRAATHQPSPPHTLGHERVGHRRRRPQRRRPRQRAAGVSSSLCATKASQAGVKISLCASWKPGKAMPRERRGPCGTREPRNPIICDPHAVPGSLPAAPVASAAASFAQIPTPCHMQPVSATRCSLLQMPAPAVVASRSVHRGEQHANGDT